VTDVTKFAEISDRDKNGEEKDEKRFEPSIYDKAPAGTRTFGRPTKAFNAAGAG
jgi:hypothetical protein